jgi:hypothetical protein
MSVELIDGHLEMESENIDEHFHNWLSIYAKRITVELSSINPEIWECCIWVFEKCPETEKYLFYIISEGTSIRNAIAASIGFILSEKEILKLSEVNFYYSNDEPDPSDEEVV